MVAVTPARTRCSSARRAAIRRTADGWASASPGAQEAPGPSEKVATPGSKTIEEVAAVPWSAAHPDAKAVFLVATCRHRGRRPGQRR